MTNKEPIFIVGVQRSGTTLLAAMLAAHSRLSCGPETHFFRRLNQVEPRTLIDEGNWPVPAVDFLKSITHTNYSDQSVTPLLDKYHIDKQALAEDLRSREPGVSSILSAVTERFMQAKGKSRWAEKTPDHIAHVESIRTYFPESPVIRIVRDPRDVALSLTRVPWGAASFLEGLIYWMRLHEISDPFFKSAPNTYTLYFEDLLSRPLETLDSLCQFLGEEFEDAMLDTSVTGRQLNTRDVTWKNQAQKPIDRSRIAAWRAELPGEKNQLAEAVLGHHLAALGYPLVGKFSRLGDIYPPNQTLHFYEHALQAVAAEGVRFWRLSEDEKSTAKVFLGKPGQNWLGNRRTERVINSLSVSAMIARAIFSNHFVYWIVNSSPPGWQGYLVYVLEKLLQPYRFEPTN